MQIAAKIGAYEVIAKLGEGGMGEVYRARDTKLNRNVAIKALPDLFASDPERLVRFNREAQVLAALNHPNIAHIHGLEDSDGVPALVMELVDGPTLAERIVEGPIPLAEALAIAKQIAEGLDAAHEQGIIHRDLKPANIKIRADGTVKVLDFGLAKLVATDATSSGGPSTLSPTFATPAATLAGVILGTAAYMSPEQAKGRAADKRSDVWAFGAVLYEMLVGRRPFGPSAGSGSSRAQSSDEGEDVSDTLASVLKTEPDWNALPGDVPPPIRMLLQRALAKDRAQRLADISIAKFLMAEAANLSTPAAVVSDKASMARQPLWRRLVLPIVAAGVVGAASAAAVWVAMRPEDPHTTRLTFSPTGESALVVDAQSRDLTITPDGRHIVYKGAAGAAATQLYVRALDQLEPKSLTAPGTPRGPFASPDGQWIGFVEPSPLTLKKVAITGGPVLTICSIDAPSRGAVWGDDGSIIFATIAPGTGLQRVTSAGGAPTVLTKPNREAGEVDHLYPQFLPGSQAVLFTITSATGSIDASQVAVLDLRNGAQKVVMRGGSQARYVPSGHLVYVADGTLRAVAFDLERLEVTGTAVQVVPQVLRLPTGTAEFDIADDGTLVYVASGVNATPARTLVWVDRQGREEDIKGAPARAYVGPRLSPDGTRAALEVRDQENDIWVWDFGRATLTRVTSDPGLDQSPVWMPDGGRLVFSSDAGGFSGSIFWRASDGTGTAERLTESTNIQRPSSVTADGTRVLFWHAASGTGSDVMMATLEKDARVQPLVQTQFVERNGEVSPDGHRLAYESNDSGQFEMAVRPFPDVNKGKWQVSTAGGAQPLWAKNGQELFYLAPNGAVMSLPVQSAATWTAGVPTKLFEGPYFRGTGNNLSTVGRTYDVSPDGRRFLMIKPGGAADQTAPPPTIVVVQHWFDELKRLVPRTR